MKKITLTQGEVALVDDVDYEYLMQWKWCLSKQGRNLYAVRNRKIADGEGSRMVRMHRVIARRLNMDLSAMVDHIDNNGLNNCRSNLRSATQKQNQENRQPKIKSKSGVVGVYWYFRKKKWHAQIRHNYQEIHLGYFDTIEEAAEARRKAEAKYFTHGSKT